MADIIITNQELKDPHVEDMINLQRSAQPHSDEKVEELKTPFYYNPIFYYAFASTLGALIIWAICEPYSDERKNPGSHSGFFSDYLAFGPMAGVLGLSLGAIYGFVNRNWIQALSCGVVGLGVGLGATVITTWVAEKIFILGIILATSIQGPHTPQPGEFPVHGLAFFIFMCGRGIAWAVVSMGAGLGLGVALKSKKLLLNGLVGGMIGGLLGGLFFDPIGRFLVADAGSGGISRCVGFTAVGLFVGLFIGFFENISKEAWLQMLKGPLQGKHFILFKPAMRIGSSPKSDVYLFKDPDVEPLHATITRSGKRYLIQDEKSGKGVYVNGRKVDKYLLQPNDTVTIGETVLRYNEKARA